MELQAHALNIVYWETSQETFANKGNSQKFIHTNGPCEAFVVHDFNSALTVGETLTITTGSQIR